MVAKIATGEEEETEERKASSAVAKLGSLGGKKRAANMTPERRSETGLEEHFAGHSTVDHSKTYIRGVVFHTNFAESYHSLLKRGIIGSFHHVSNKHLHRYLAEFDRRWNTRDENDGERAVKVLQTGIGKRLTYNAMVN